jgi:hypothetical protein
MLALAPISVKRREEARPRTSLESLCKEMEGRMVR